MKYEVTFDKSLDGTIKLSVEQHQMLIHSPEAFPAALEALLDAVTDNLRFRIITAYNKARTLDK